MPSAAHAPQWPGPSPEWLGSRITVPSAAEAQQQARQAQALGAHSGAVHFRYSPHADAQGGRQCPWPFHPEPLLVSSQAWSTVAPALLQWAQVLELTLADVYGPQRLLQAGVLPSALVHGHPHYLRELRHAPRPAHRHLHALAIDLIPDRSGPWWVVAVRAQSPSGWGYALHNRQCSAALHPQAMQHLGVRALLDPGHDLGAGLWHAATQVAHREQGGSPPHVVVWTPGIWHESHWEQAHMARLTGWPLVEGQDLTVLEDRLYQRTVGGLRPVHGLWRRVEDEWTDPLELRPDSRLGVAGLLRVLRAGRLAMANPPGASVIESPACFPFWPGVASALGLPVPDLRFVPTQWPCPEAQASRGPMGVVRHVFPQAGRTAPTAEAVQANHRAEQGPPSAWCVQQPLPCAPAPRWGVHPASSRPAMVRVFLQSRPEGGWSLWSGGLGRLAAQDGLEVSLHHGGVSADVWVLGEHGPSASGTASGPAPAAPISPRMAEHLFWWGRHAQRLAHALASPQANWTQHQPLRQALWRNASAVRHLWPPGSAAWSEGLFDSAWPQPHAPNAGPQAAPSLALGLAELARQWAHHPQAEGHAAWWEAGAALERLQLWLEDPWLPNPLPPVPEPEWRASFHRFTTAVERLGRQAPRAAAIHDLLRELQSWASRPPQDAQRPGPGPSDEPPPWRWSTAIEQLWCGPPDEPHRP